MQRKRILLVDDEEALRKGVTRILRDSGYDVETASDGPGALVAVRSSRPDLLLLDLMLPGMDGLEVCKEIRRESEVPILMLTARDDDVDRILGLELGADDYLTKPFHARELVLRIRAILRRAGATYTGQRLLLDEERIEVDYGRQEVRVGGKTTASPQPNSRCWPISRGIRARSSRATGCWRRSGDTTSLETFGRWMCMCAGCGASWSRTPKSHGSSLRALVSVTTLRTSASLRWRIAGLFGAGALLITGLLTGLGVEAMAQAQFARTQISALSAVEGVSEALSAAMATHANDYGSVARSAARAAGGAVYWLDGGTVLAQSIGGRAPDIPSSLAGLAYPEVTFSTRHGTWTVIAAAPVGAGLGARGQVVLVRRLSALQRELMTLQRRLWAVGAFAAVTFAMLGFLFARSIAAPLEHLTLAARRMSAGDLAQRVPLQGSGEVATLSRVFNEMAARVATLDALRRRFVADAAHELRTPVAGMQALAESLLAGENDLPEDVRDTLRGIASESDRLSRLVAQLLELAKLDNPDIVLERRLLRVPDSVQEALWVLRAAAAQRNIGIRLEAEEAWANADPDWLHRAILNVLDNGVRHSHDGASLDVSVRGEQDWVEISVADRGPGVSSEDLARLGDRFVRLSNARERSSGGAGLGLAIVRDVLTRHRGDVIFAQRLGGGLKVTLRLPRAQAPREL